MQEAISNRRKLKANESDVLFKKANAARALALDRQRAEEKRKEQKESLQDLNARRRLDVERQLVRIFTPIPRPHEHLPVYCQRLNVDLTVTTRQVRKHKGAKGEPILFVEIDSVHQLEMLHLCNHYSSLMRPFVQAGETEIGSILTRPAFCRMLIELTFADTHGGIMYHTAIDIFDGLAAQHSVKGSPLTGALVLGIPVDDHSDRIIQLFANILATAARESKHGVTADEFKAHLFDCLMPAAERKCRRRQRHIAAQLAYGKDIYRMPLGSTGGTQVDEELEILPEKQEKDPFSRNATKSRTNRESQESFNLPPTVAASWPLARHRSSGGIPPALELDARNFSKGTTNLSEDPSDIGMSPLARDDFSVISEPDDDDGNQDQTEEEALYAHTCMVSKGEYLTSMLLEPEIVQLVWMYFDSFEYLFQVYLDTQTSFLQTPAACHGHMSNEAFLQFCIDFRLFPQIIDFNSLNCYYQSAESIIEITRDEVKRCTKKDAEESAFQVGDVVEVPAFLRQGKNGKLRPGDAMKVIAVDTSDVDAEAVLVMTARLKKLWVKMGQIKKAEKDFVSSEKAKTTAKVASKATWINKDFEEMTELEKRSLTILSSFADYMSSRKVRSKDFFSKFDESGDGSIDAEELMKGITFMSLAGNLRTSISTPPPDLKEVEQLFRLIDADGDGTLDYMELDIVMKTVQERKSKQAKASNFFVKDEIEMSDLEKLATGFFVPLWNYFEANKWTVRDFFARFDTAGHGHLSFRELKMAGEELGFTCSFEKFDRAMMLLDANLDGAISPEELMKVMNFVKVRMDLLNRRAQKKEELANPFAKQAQVDSKSEEKNYKISCFGLKAFIESVLRMGLGHLSFHGTPEQSTLPATTKALWIITHIQQQLDDAQDKGESGEEEADNEYHMDVNKRVAWEAALQQFGNKRRSLDKVLEEFRQLGFKPKGEASGGEEDEEEVIDAWKGVAPIDRVKAERPDLFKNGPVKKPVVIGKNWERQGTCPDCRVEPMNGWGNMYCPKCGHADAIVRACLANNKHYDLHKLPALDKIICLLGTSMTPPGPQHVRNAENYDRSGDSPERRASRGSGGLGGGK